jgi:uncharacterized protein (TIGR00730 family)
VTAEAGRPKTRAMRRVCVFCGSRPGARPEYAAAARALGGAIAAGGGGLVYGGASVGVMREIADAVLAAGGEVIGVIPRALVDREVAHEGLTELRVVPTMHVRKATMAELADGFVALPGGFGTLDELFEILTWAQLGMHRKPVGLLNVAGFWDPLLALVEHMVEEGFVPEDQRALLLVERDPVSLLARMDTWVPPVLGPKWIGVEET